MFSMEEGALDILNKAIDKYEKHFDVEINMLDYVDVTHNDKYDFSIEGVKKFEKMIDKQIEINEPFEVPEGDEHRVY